MTEGHAYIPDINRNNSSFKGYMYSISIQYKQSVNVSCTSIFHDNLVMQEVRNGSKAAGKYFENVQKCLSNDLITELKVDQG